MFLILQLMMLYKKSVCIYTYIYITRCMMKNLNTNMTLWKDKVTLQKVGVTSWKDRNATNMDKTIKGKCPQGVCSGEGEYITHHTCSNGNELDMLQRVIAAENLTACEGYESTRHVGANNVILLQENVNRMMGL